MRQGRVVLHIDASKIAFGIHTVNGPHAYAPSFIDFGFIKGVLVLFKAEGNIKYVLRPTIEAYENS
jgi:hypothetical protein